MRALQRRILLVFRCLSSSGVQKWMRSKLRMLSLQFPTALIPFPAFVTGVSRRRKSAAKAAASRPLSPLSPRTTCSNFCQRAGGTWNSTSYHCDVTGYLSRVCLRFAPVANSSLWILDSPPYLLSRHLTQSFPSPRVKPRSRLRSHRSLQLPLLRHTLFLAPLPLLTRRIPAPHRSNPGGPLFSSCDTTRTRIFGPRRSPAAAAPQRRKSALVSAWPVRGPPGSSEWGASSWCCWWWRREG